MKELFHRIANRVSKITGTPLAFITALMIVVVWAFTGPLFGYSDTWQLVINTGTTIVTFLMVFLIQNTQNRDSKAVQLKLDELIRSSGQARNSFIDLEDISDDELGTIDEEFQRIHSQLPLDPTLHKLHEKILAEHRRRSHFKKH